MYLKPSEVLYCALYFQVLFNLPRLSGVQVCHYGAAHLKAEGYLVIPGA
jgi:hypothetical protein